MAALLGSCMREVCVGCHVSSLTSFRALHGISATREDMPVCLLLQQALLLHNLANPVPTSSPAAYAAAGCRYFGTSKFGGRGGSRAGR